MSRIELIEWIVILLAVGSFLLFLPQLGWIAGVIAFGVCFIGMIAILRLPPEALYWAKGARGERKTAEAIEPLMTRGFVPLYGKVMPDDRGEQPEGVG